MKVIHNKCKWIFDVNAQAFKNGSCKCPLCFNGDCDTELFKRKVFDLVGDEFSVIGTYINSKTKIRMRHNQCSHPDGYYEWDSVPSGFTSGGGNCLYCCHQVGYDLDYFKKRLQEEKPDYKCIGNEYINSRTKVDVECSNGHIFGLTLDNLNSKEGFICPYCTNKKIWIGYNDMWTTNPEIAIHLTNPEDGYKYTYHTGKKLDFNCPYCGGSLHKLPSILYNENGEFVCNYCSDNISYPEKFVSNVLRQLNLKFNFQLTSSDFDWCQKYRYDFYIPNNYTIIETHGIQHYEQSNKSWGTLESTIENDIKKRELALSNGIRNYIEIDCRVSDPKFIKTNIINSKLSEMYDLSVIDWDKCALDSSVSLLVKICKEWDNEVDTYKDYQNKYQLSSSTIKKYLIQGASLGLCEFDVDKYNERINANQNAGRRVSIKCLETGVIYNSIADAERQTGISSIHTVLSGRTYTAGGLHWVRNDSKTTEIVEHIKKPIIRYLDTPISCYLNNEYIDTFNSFYYIYKFLNKEKCSNIYRALKNNNLSAYGYHWYYADDPNQPDKTRIINDLQECG